MDNNKTTVIIYKPNAFYEKHFSNTGGNLQFDLHLKPPFMTDSLFIEHNFLGNSVQEYIAVFLHSTRIFEVSKKFRYIFSMYDVRLNSSHSLSIDYRIL